MQQLTRPQSDLLEYIKAHKIIHQNSPTHQEIMAHFGWASTNAVHTMLKLIEAKGYIRLTEGKSRGIFVL